jgi:hypothetical protein
MEAADRRSQKRIPVEMWVEEQRGADVYYQRSANLSVGGIYLDGTIPHARGTFVQLRFTLPGTEEPLSVRGEIVGEPDEERLGMHVRFLAEDLEGPLGETLRSYVERPHE